MIYQCRVCGYIFDEEREEKSFEEVSTCPRCKVGAQAFECTGGSLYCPNGEKISLVRVGIYDCRSGGRNNIRKANQISAQCKSACRSIFGDYCEYTHYVDLGLYAGDNLNRPFFKQMMEDVKAGKLDVIVVLTLSVIASEVPLILDTYKILKQHNVKLITVADGDQVSAILDKALES